MAKKKESVLKSDISKQIAETKKVLANAQKSLAEKTSEVSDLKAKLRQLEKSANPPEDSKSLTGKWFKTEKGDSTDEYNKQYYYIVKDHGSKLYANGTVSRKLTVFYLNMAFWESKGLLNDIAIYRYEMTEMFDPEELDVFIPVKLDEIKKEILKKFSGMFKVLDNRNILPEAFKPFVAQKKKRDIQP